MRLATTARTLSLFLLISSAPTLAEDYPAYDKAIERAAIEKLQEKLPDMRGPLGLYAMVRSRDI